MQVSLGKTRVTNNDKLVLDVMADRYCIQILQAINTEPKSVSQLSSECGIFLGVAYRKIKILKKSGLLDIHYEIRPDGKKFFLYKSRVKGIVASFVGNKLEVATVLEKE
ncbi:MAG TPA: helix-turn-helix domain-containing protein [Candidatus Nitrosotalea sp.]|nr:helix-turn-helix domain-containing protein [Candidatus Nitrosotalea sp.]